MLRSTILTGLLILLAAIPCPVAAQDSPNVLLITIDDLNDWIGCLQGHPQALTPNIDRLASRGVLFSSAHCVAPACRPSRAALLSGMTPRQTGVWSNRSASLLKQNPDVVTLPQVFQRAGYSTRGTGKLIHQGGDGQRLFQEYFRPEQRWSPLTRDSVRYRADELPSKGTDNPQHIVEGPDGTRLVLPLNRMPSDRKPDNPDGESFDWGPFDVPDSAMGDAQITDWAIEHLQQQQTAPLFLAVGYYRPHIPLWAPNPYFERFHGLEIQLPPTRDDDLSDLSETARGWALEPITAGLHATVIRHGQWQDAVKAYLACITFVDGQIGRIIDTLDASRLSDNTVVVLLSDHGWHLGEKQHWGKWTGWERSTRVPLIIVPPRNQDAGNEGIGATCRIPVSLLDVFPTLTEICGVPAPESLDGTTLAPLLNNPATESDRSAVTWFERDNVTIRTQRWRYVRYADGSEELYDHQTDPHEWHNLVGQPSEPAILQELRQQANAASGN